MQNKVEKKPYNWTTAQAWVAVSGGYAIRLPFHPCETLTLTPAALKFAAPHGLLPNESPETVENKSKANTVAKVLV
ncbi:hypothetical protein BS50DRAFT_580030 [Corynespora cassiicola Philippines]|uniref:Uncharacterized protein n=1 Tax=Corynespora cassiicola Philippines TaxID=1448308 RepID=A0A2T2N215_CORCC|nr:hypothetical protein BS50DRAFT_580030 [Corynespora cassiicola Philippines]